MRKRTFFGAIAPAALAAGLLAAAPAAAGDWAMARGNPARTGFAAEQAEPPLTRAWTFRAGGGVVSGPVTYGGRVYFGCRDGSVYALDAATGALLWRFQSGGRVDSTPAVTAGALYAASSDGYLYSLNPASGAFNWKAALGAPSVSSPLPYGGLVYVGAGLPENKLKAFSAADGSPAGEFKAAQPVDSAPSTDGSLVYFGANDGRLYAVSPAGLLQAWSYQTMGGRYGLNAVAVSSGVVYALPGFDENKPLAFAAADGTLLSSLTAAFETAVPQADGSIPWAQVGSPAAAPGRLYFSGGFSANNLYALDPVPSGSELSYLWGPKALGALSNTVLLSAPAAANDTVYAGTVEGALVAFSSAGASVPLSDVSFSSPVYASPAVSNGMVFAASAGGEVSGWRALRAAAISAPAPGGVVTGTVAVSGYISNPALAGYELHYSTRGGTAVWHLLASSSTAHAVSGGALGAWDLSALGNGLYDLRLTVLESPAAVTDNTAVVTVRADRAPEPPASLAAADVPGDSGNRIKLDWAASPSAGLAAYRIYRNAGEGVSFLASVSSSSLTYTDPAAATGSTYTYTVRAYDGWLESADSAQAAAFSVNNTGDFTPPSRITDLAAVPGAAGGGVQLSWTAPGDDGSLGTASLYVIRYTSVPAYNWAEFDGGALPGGTRAVEGPAGAPEAELVTGLKGGVTYYFAIKAADAVPNYSQLSPVATAYAAVDLVPPQPPSALTAADTPGDGGGSITLKWTLSPDDGAGAGDVYGYNVYRRTQSGTFISSAPYAVTASSAGYYLDSAAPDNVRYYYAVAAFDSTNISAFTPEAWAVSADNWRFFDAGAGVDVRLADGARVEVPASAASQNDSIMFTRLDPGTYKPLFRAASAGAYNPTGIVYEAKFKSAATRLLSPALVYAPYTPADVAGMDMDNVRLYMLSGGSWVMVDNSRADEAASRVAAKVLQLGVFAVMEYVPSGELFARDEVYTYPNPAKGDSLTFKFRVSEKSYVKIDVYDIAGQKVARLEKAGCPAGVTSEIPWNIRKTASGVYQFRFEATGASGKKSVVKRLAIVH